MEKLTLEQRRLYLRNGGSNCPYCKSFNIEGAGGFDFDGGHVYENIVCNNCGKEWTDEYTLTGVTEMEELE